MVLRTVIKQTVEVSMDEASRRKARRNKSLRSGAAKKTTG